MSEFYLRQATASQTRLIGPFVDDTDFKTLETGLTIANTDIKLSSEGGSAVNKNSGGATHIVNGEYAITLDATDTASVGELKVSVLVSGALVQTKTFRVVEEAIYDAFYAPNATGLLPANVTQWRGTEPGALTDTDKLQVSVQHMGTDVLGAGNIADNAFSAEHFAANSLNGKGNWNVDKTGYSLTPTTGLGNQTANITGNLSGSVGSVSGNVGGNVSGSVGSISGVTFPTNFGDLAISATTGYVDLGFIKGVDAITQLGSTCATALSVSLSTFDWTGITVGAVSDKAGFSLAADQSGVTIGTVNAMAGTITTLDALDAAQDLRHDTTQSDISTAQDDLDILTGTDGATVSTASAAAIGTAFLSTALSKGTAGTIERAFWQILKTQAVTDGTAVADASNTTTAFYTDLTAADSVYDHMIILFTSNGLEGEARPIDTYVQTNGVITLQEALTTAPTGDEEFIILPQHAHPISEIQDGLATSANQTTILNRLGAFTGTGVNTVLGFFKALFRNDASLPSDIGGSYAASTMSLEANKSEHDATQTAVSAVSTSGGWTDDEKDEIRYRLGIDGDTSAPLTNSPNLEIGGAAGSGSDLVTLTLKDGLGNVVSDAEVWISTDLAGTDVTAGTLRTNDLGKVTFMLDHGTSYYRWADKSGVNFTNPTQFTAVRD